MRGSTDVGNPQRGTTETQTRNLDETETSRGRRKRVQERGEMKMTDTGTLRDEKRARKTGEVIELGERSGAGRDESGRETSCLMKNCTATITEKTERKGERQTQGVTAIGTQTDTETRRGRRREKGPMTRGGKRGTRTGEGRSRAEELKKKDKA